MAEFLELRMKVYVYKELKDFIKNKDTEYDEGDSWKVALNTEGTPPPYSIARISLRVDDIQTFAESRSLELSFANPGTADFDCTEITIRDGDTLVVEHTYDEIKKMLGR